MSPAESISEATGSPAPHEPGYGTPVWARARGAMTGLPGGRGLNIAHEAVDRHASGPNADAEAVRWLDRDMAVRTISYRELAADTSRFANVLAGLGVRPGERVFTLLGRVPELYVVVLGALKARCVASPLFAAFGPEPVVQRMLMGGCTLGCHGGPGAPRRRRTHQDRDRQGLTHLDPPDRSNAGPFARIRGGGVDWRNGIALGVVGIPAAYLGTLLNRQVSQPVLLLAFAGLTIIAAAAMLLNARGKSEPAAVEPTADIAASGAATPTEIRDRSDRSRLVVTAAKVVVCGAAVGFLTGYLGVGGGFLVVPALVIVLRMPMILAVGTSLLVIVLNSISSMVSRYGTIHLDWRVIAPFTIAAAIGTLIGKLVADKLSGDALTRAFAILLVAVGTFVGVQSLISL